MRSPTAGKGGFNIYDDIKSKLIAAGMPPEQIAFIHDADTDERKKALFAKVRSGQVRVLIRSTANAEQGRIPRTGSSLCTPLTARGVPGT